jgi:kynureninase
MMIRIPECSKVLDAVAALFARALQWSPIGKDVVVVIENSEDGWLTGARLPGVVRAYADNAGISLFLVQLEQVLQHRGRLVSKEIEMLVATSALRWHRANRLMITWVAVLVVDAPSFADQHYDRAIGTGRLELLGSSIRPFSRPGKS